MNLVTSTSHPGIAGKRVLVTRPRHQAAALSDRLRGAGAIPVELPVIEIVPATSAELDAALNQIDEYDWIVFTSVNAVTIVAERLSGIDTVQVAAIGDATAAALEENGITVDLVPDEFVAEAVLDALIERGVAGKRVLLPRADIARNALPDGLRAAGATVDVVPAYSTRTPTDVDREIVQSVRSGGIDVVTFTSPSTVRNLMALIDNDFPSNTNVACIGPITADAARGAGLRVDIVASEYSVPGLVRALVESGESDESS